MTYCLSSNKRPGLPKVMCTITVTRGMEGSDWPHLVECGPHVGRKPWVALSRGPQPAAMLKDHWWEQETAKVFAGGCGWCLFPTQAELEGADECHTASSRRWACRADNDSLGPLCALTSEPGASCQRQRTCFLSVWAVLVAKGCGACWIVCLAVL